MSAATILAAWCAFAPREASKQDARARAREALGRHALWPTCAARDTEAISQPLLKTGSGAVCCCDGCCSRAASCTV